MRDITMAVDEAQIAAKMREQHGLIVRSQALAAGMTRHRIQRRVRSGEWRSVRSGIYQQSATPVTARSRLLAACIAVSGLASHRSAAALHGLDGFELTKIDVVVSPERARAVTGMRLHRSAHMHLARPITLDNIPCTGLARTLLDLAALLDRRLLERAVDAALRDQRLRYVDLYNVIARHAANGRNGLVPLRAVLDERCADDPVPLSDWSRWVGELLTDSGLPAPTLEHRVHDADGRFVAQVDLAYPIQRLAVELDSIRWHHNRESFESDRNRRNRLIAAGWDVMAFTWREYTERPDSLCAVVAQTLGRGATD